MTSEPNHVRGLNPTISVPERISYSPPRVPPLRKPNNQQAAKPQLNLICSWSYAHVVVHIKYTSGFPFHRERQTCICRTIVPGARACPSQHADRSQSCLVLEVVQIVLGGDRIALIGPIQLRRRLLLAIPICQQLGSGVGIWQAGCQLWGKVLASGKRTRIKFGTRPQAS